jgi:ABC-type branched-subunit amino acid transport system permease subunit
MATSSREELLLVGVFALGILTMPLWMAPLGASYPALLQKFAIYGLFAVGFNILFGLTGYLSFGHAAFLGAGSYAAVWCFKLLTMNVLAAVIVGTTVGALFALAIGYFCLRRSGIYFSILTLAFAQMTYILAYSVLMPITNGETGLRIASADPRIFDTWFYGASDIAPHANLFGISMSGYNGFYLCAVLLIGGFYIAMRIARSPFGTMLRAIKSNQIRLHFVGAYPRGYALSAFVISGAYAGLAGALLAVTDPLAGPERMQWTASGEVIFMTILGGAGTLIGPVLGATIIKYFESIFSSFSARTLRSFFDFLPDTARDIVVGVTQIFVGEGWQLTLGGLFLFVVIFLPGGAMEGIRRVVRWANSKGGSTGEQVIPPRSSGGHGAAGDMTK